LRQAQFGTAEQRNSGAGEQETINVAVIARSPDFVGVTRQSYFDNEVKIASRNFALAMTIKRNKKGARNLSRPFC
jgi:hypothetical protein